MPDNHAPESDRLSPVVALIDLAGRDDATRLFDRFQAATGLTVNGRVQAPAAPARGRVATDRLTLDLCAAADLCALFENVLAGDLGLEAAVVPVDAEHAGEKYTASLHRILAALGNPRPIILDGGDGNTGAAFARALAGSEGPPAIALAADDPDSVTALVDALAAIDAPAPAAERPLRLVVRRVEPAAAAAAIVAVGELLCGDVSPGEALLISPGDHYATATAVERKDGLVRLTLDGTAEVNPGDIVSGPTDPPSHSDTFRAILLWRGGSEMAAGTPLRAEVSHVDVGVRIESLGWIVDPARPTDRREVKVGPGVVLEATVKCDEARPIDPYRRIPETGRLVLTGPDGVVAVGLIALERERQAPGPVEIRSTNVTEVAHKITSDMRVRQAGHHGGVMWFTGLSGAGKSTLAVEVERRLFQMGYRVYVLDGDNVRHGLNADLSFSPEDRAENIRRIGEVAALFAEAGMIVVTAFISPYRSDRARARQAAPDAFHEVYISAGLEECEQRDPKGLYKKARRGEIPDFTGISAPYEPPDAPELTVDTVTQDVNASVEAILDYVSRNFALSD